MRRGLLLVLLAGLLCGAVFPAFGQGRREDSIWARTTTDPITLDGVLSEPAWAKAESLIVIFGKDSGMPGSGWKIEGGVLPSDSTYAVLKLLVKDNQLYLGAEVDDESVGGSKDWNRWDGLLMSLKNHAAYGFPKPMTEYFYSWWYEHGTDPQPVGQLPRFKGRWANDDERIPRDSTQIANWDAVTVVHGFSNSDTTNDAGYTVEMRFNLTPMGYDVTRPEGDVVEWNISIYDCDWLWPININRLSYNRVWVQDPWGGDDWFDEVHVFARPSVTVNSGPAPYLFPEFIVPEAIGYSAPTIDGSLSEAVWGETPSFRITYGDSALRAGYPGVGPVRSGQYQPPVNGGYARVKDPGDATVKMFVKGDFLYLGFDVNDKVVQYHALYDRWDGFLVSIVDRLARDAADHVLKGRRLSFQVGAAGTALPQDYLATMVAAGKAQVALTLKPGTTVDTLGVQADTGYRAEMALDLTYLGYPTGLGDGLLFIGVDLLDGDSFTPYTDSYGTRTWWFREREGRCCPAWAFLSHAPLTGVEDPAPRPPTTYALLGAFPNPAVRQTIRYSLPQASRVTLDVIDVQGRRVEHREIGIQAAGERQVQFDGSSLGAGLYLYRLKMADPLTGAVKAVLNGRMMLVR